VTLPRIYTKFTQAIKNRDYHIAIFVLFSQCFNIFKKHLQNAVLFATIKLYILGKINV